MVYQWQARSPKNGGCICYLYRIRHCSALMEEGTESLKGLVAL